MDTDVLVIGGSVAGLQAALDLADTGLRIQLIESSPFLDQNGTKVPGHVLRARQLQLLKHPNIRTQTNTVLERMQADASGFRLELVQHPRYIDLARCTACGACIDACPVEVPGKDRKAIYLDGQPGCVAIDKAGLAPCAHTCPAGIHVQGYVALIAQGRYREAIDLIHEAMPFPSVCGRVCNHSCEAECTRGKVDEPVNIMALKRFVADWEYEQWCQGERAATRPVEISSPSGKQVAIIGAGPAGLTAARDLNRAGHRVTVFEALPVAGGMMRVGIPEHRLPDELLDWEIQRILDEGATLQLSTRIDDIPGLLQNGYDAVLIATGAHLAKKLPIRNADHPDNWLSLDLLRRAALGEDIDLSGKRIVVLGGGNVALDSARTALRLGASEVRMACLEPRGEMPGFEWEIAVAEEEGVKVCPGRTFKEIVLTDGRITGVRCVEVVFRGFKAGRPDIDEIPGSEHVLPAERVVWAIGQAADVSFLPEDGSISTRKPGGIQSGSDMMTTLPGVFVAGDVHRGVTFFVVDAIGEGHRAAAGIDRFLKGGYGAAVPARPEKVRYRKSQAKARLKRSSQAPRVEIASISMEARVHNFSEVDLPISEQQARTEASRCLVCGPCSDCQVCVQACPTGAIAHDQRETAASLNARAIVYADREEPAIPALHEGAGVHMVAPEDPLAASAAAGRILAGLRKGQRANPTTVAPVQTAAPTRIGVFICECGDQIGGIVNTGTVRKKASALPGVVHAGVLSFSCTPEGAAAIHDAVAAHDLNGVVLAACSCCALDQACYSCTYQRLRSRQNLGVLPGSEGQTPGLEGVRFAFVNIREQCAWVHAGEPRAAARKALTLVTGAVAGLQAAEPVRGAGMYTDRSVLMLGGGEAAQSCEQLLKQQGIHTKRIKVSPAQVVRTGGLFVAEHRGRSWSGAALLLAPRDAHEGQRLLASFGENGLRPRIREQGKGVDTHRPGVFYCDPDHDPSLIGSAAAARAAAWLGRAEMEAGTTAVVDPARCRACGTCVEICEFGAPELVETQSGRSAHIDPLVCLACGTCKAHCPSGAISLPSPGTAGIAPAVTAMLAGGD